MTPRTAPDRSLVQYAAVTTPLGTVHVAQSPRGVLRVGLPGTTPERFLTEVRSLAPGATLRHAPAALRPVSRQLREYCAGQRRRFDLPLDLRASGFTQRVLRRLCRVPYGATVTYGDLARAAGSPGGARAAGQACGRNPLPLVIPCHRVVAAGGRLGGFGGGLRLKARLLELEAQARSRRQMKTSRPATAR